MKSSQKPKYNHRLFHGILEDSLDSDG